ncbi:LPD7 domain-containing protein, partial [Pseudomonas savastanoi]|uniref:LPD7 domain-containing protein n=4 Tax=Pseudomonas syringae group TaxID=136849 RepID=UPI002E0F8586
DCKPLHLEDEKEDPGFSISGARGPGPEGVRDRVKRVMDRFAKQIDPAGASERARDLSAKDLYTRKAKFSQNVDYPDKQTDKTLFVDTGTAISMRRTGITEAGVSVALQLARERFGSTLTINGTAEFKKLVIEAVAKNGLDVHFTEGHEPKLGGSPRRAGD